MKRMDKLILIQVRDEETEAWQNWKQLLASINNSGAVNRFGVTEEYADGAERAPFALVFEVRYQPDLERLRDGGLYRIVYRGNAYNLVGFDDYFEQHQTIKLSAQSYGEKP